MHETRPCALATDETPGHWLLTKLGKRVLRPGGMELTQQLVRALDVGPNDDVVEFAPGLGVTAKLNLITFSSRREWPTLALILSGNSSIAATMASCQFAGERTFSLRRPLRRPSCHRRSVGGRDHQESESWLASFIPPSATAIHGSWDVPWGRSSAPSRPIWTDGPRGSTFRS